MSPLPRWTSELLPAAAIAGACVFMPAGGVVFSVATGIAGGLATPLSQRGGDWCMQRMFRQPELLNHDLQSAMLRAFDLSMNDLQKAWLDSHQRDASPHLSNGNASQDAVKALFQDMREDAKTILSADRLRGIIGSPETIQLLDRGGLTLERKRPEDEASEERDTEAGPRNGAPDASPMPLKSPDTYAAWLKSVASMGSVRLRIADERDALRAYLQPYLDGHSDQLVRFLHDNFQPQLACRFGEELKKDSKAWRAFQRLVNDSLLDGVREMHAKQDAAQLTLDQILWELENWKERLVQLPITEREPTGEAALESVIAALREQFEILRQEMRELAETTWARVESEGIDTRGHVTAEVAQARAELNERLDQLSGFSSVAKELERARDLLEQTSFSPHAYYNGRKPVWANIVAGHDAPRSITDDVVAFVTRHVSSPIGAPVAVIHALSGDGKSTIAMRTAATIVETGLNVVWRNDPASRELNWKQLDAESRSAPLVAILDDAHQFAVDELESFLDGLYQVGANVLIVLFVRRDLWLGSDTTLHRIAEVEDFEVKRLDRGEVQGILTKLETSGELGNLEFLSAEERVLQFEERGDGQLLVALLEAKESKAFSGIVSRSIRDLRSFEHAEEACYVVSALHTFDTPCSPNVLSKLLGVRSVDAEVLKRTQGMLVGPESGFQGIQMRHAVFATTVFQLDAGRYDRLRSYVETALTKTGSNTDQIFADERDIVRLLGNIRQRFKLMDLDYMKIRMLYSFSAELSGSASSIVTQWALFEHLTDNSDQARRLFQRATETDRTYSEAWQAWVKLELEQGEITEARRLFQLATEAVPLSARLWQAWAILEKEQGEIAEARRLFQQATEADRTLIVAWQAWTRLELDQGDIAAARQVLQRATEAVPLNPPLWHVWARLERQQGDILAARRVLHQATEAMPLNGQLWRDRAVLEQEQGDISEARKLFQQASEAVPMDTQLWRAWARFEKQQGDVAAARKLLQQVSESNPTNMLLWRDRAVLEQEQGDISEARKLFQQATEMVLMTKDPDERTLIAKRRSRRRRQRLPRTENQSEPSRAYANTRSVAQLWSDWARLEQKQGDVTKARQLYAKVTEAEPTNGAAWVAWAILEQEQGDTAAATRLLQRAIEIGPRHSEAWLAWAILEKEKGRWAKARQLFQTITEIDSTNVKAWQNWAIMEKQLGKRSRARELFAIATEAGSREAERLLEQYKLEDAKGNNERSLELLQDFENANRVVSHAWLAWANLEWEVGDITAAQCLYRTATAVDQHNSYAWHAWATFKKAQGDIASARNLYRRAVKAGPDNIRAWHSWGEMEEQRGNSAMARSLFRHESQARKRSSSE